MSRGPSDELLRSPGLAAIVANPSHLTMWMVKGYLLSIARTGRSERLNMTDYLKRRLQQTGLILVAIPAIGWLPFGFGLLLSAVWQLIFGFDDFDMVTPIIGILIGLVLALAALFYFVRGLWRGEIRFPAKVVMATACFSLLSVPVSSVIIKIVERG